MTSSSSTTILAVSVGGSCQPLITAITDYRPQYVVFIASEGPRGSLSTVTGPGKPCTGREPEDSKPSIAAQTGLKESQFEIHPIADPDSLQACYSVTRSALTKAMQQYPNSRYVADYTGGTKTMSVALAMAALESNWDLSLVKGARTDLIKVVDGTEVAGLVNSWEVRARQRMEEVRRLFDNYNYASAETLASNILQTGALSTQLQTQLREWVGLARGFDAWDRFDHERALQILTPYQSRVVPGFRFLKLITGTTKQRSGYEPVFDLVRNSERRAHQKRFDDAVARLYRACEMLAQIKLTLRTPTLDSSNIAVQALPEALRPAYDQLRDPNSGKIQLGLRQDYELLSALDDPLGIVYRTHEKRLLNGLSARNASILAHGISPIGDESYQKFAEVLNDLIRDATQRLDIRVDAPQFPPLS